MTSGPATTAPTHTCHGAIFCGTPRAVAHAECPVCSHCPDADCIRPKGHKGPHTDGIHAPRFSR